ncbi:MAG: HEPN domain-containing protein, partial [Planctomycetota bacterium]
MRRKRFAADDPREWLNRARSNLARAEHVFPGAYLEDLCFDAQQAAEKAVKAVFIHRGIDFPYVHDLARLLSLLEEAGCKIPASVQKAEALTRFAVESRYPGLAGPVRKRDYERLVRIAGAVLQWASRELA